jgi:hypothetical protein
MKGQMKKFFIILFLKSALIFSAQRNDEFQIDYPLTVVYKGGKKEYFVWDKKIKGIKDNCKRNYISFEICFEDNSILFCQKLKDNSFKCFLRQNNKDIDIKEK